LGLGLGPTPTPTPFLIKSFNNNLYFINLNYKFNL